MNSIPQPEHGDPLYPDGSSATSAVIEVTCMSIAYIAVAHLTVANVNLEAFMPAMLQGPDRQIGATFALGAAIQIGLVFLFALLFSDLRRAIRNSLKLGTVPAWGAAIIAVSIHASTIAFVFLEDPGQILEQSARNLFLSVVPAFDGWSQEVFFRGYVVYRLARAGVPVPLLFVFSAVSFASIHIGYIGSDFYSVFWPMFGTAVLGAFLTWSVLLARGALLPVIVCHAALIAVIQPWLALN